MSLSTSRLERMRQVLSGYIERIKKLRLDEFEIGPMQDSSNQFSLSLYRTLALECVVGM
jgi:hypothetical protein